MPKDFRFRIVVQRIKGNFEQARNEREREKEKRERVNSGLDS